MFSLSWARCLTGAAVLSAAAISTVASATTGSFESAPPLTVVGPGQADASYTEAGFTFTPTGGDALVDLSFCAVGVESCIRNNATTYLTALNGAEVTITAPRAFSIQGLDVAFFPLPLPAPGLFAGALMGLQLSGTLWDGGLATLTLPLLEDAANPGDFLFEGWSIGNSPLFSSLTLGACAFIGPNCVRSGADFDNAGFLFNDLQFAIDNLSLTSPAPSALWLMALSLGGLALTRRRLAR
ncbi:MAG: hypothetical protein IPM99_22785 [Rubrivivax sp.]|nr:hypothetical protein [Rubrivivax sp.]